MTKICKTEGCGISIPDHRVKCAACTKNQSRKNPRVQFFGDLQRGAFIRGSADMWAARVGPEPEGVPGPRGPRGASGPQGPRGHSVNAEVLEKYVLQRERANALGRQIAALRSREWQWGPFSLVAVIAIGMLVGAGEVGLILCCLISLGRM